MAYDIKKMVRMSTLQALAMRVKTELDILHERIDGLKIPDAISLYNDVDSESTQLAATANAVKIAYDTAIVAQEAADMVAYEIAALQTFMDTLDSPSVGDIKHSYNTQLGDNWLLCDGSAVNSTDYPELANYCTELNGELVLPSLLQENGPYPYIKGR